MGKHRARLKPALLRFIDALIDQGQTATLRAMVAGRLPLLEAHEAWLRGELKAGEPPEYNLNAKSQLDAWLHGNKNRPPARYRPRTRLGIEKALQWLWKRVPPAARDAVGEPNVRVRELPALLEGFRGHTNYATFHTLKSACQAYARDTFTQESELWIALKGVDDLPKPIARSMARRAPLVMPWEARVIRLALLVNCKAHRRAEAREAARLWWLSCLTGMGPMELFEDGYALVDEGCEVHGAKTKHRVRVVPQVLDDKFYAAPRITRANYENRVERASRFCGIAVSPYSGRRAFSHWEEEAGVPHSRRQSHLGHGAGSMTTHYALEVKPYMDEDGQKLIDYVSKHAFGPPATARRRVRPMLSV